MPRSRSTWGQQPPGFGPLGGAQAPGQLDLGRVLEDAAGDPAELPLGRAQVVPPRSVDRGHQHHPEVLPPEPAEQLAVEPAGVPEIPVEAVQPEHGWVRVPAGPAQRGEPGQRPRPVAGNDQP